VIELISVTARGRFERGRPRPVLAGVSLRAERGVLAIVGAPKDGTALLFDVVDGTIRPRAGRVLAPPPSLLARVAFGAPLPDALRVEEVAQLEAAIRGAVARKAAERLDVLGAAALASRPVASLSFEERRTAALALALTTTNADVVLLEEPLAMLDPVAPSRVREAVRAKAKDACVIVTTASQRDAAALGERFARLSAGALTSFDPAAEARGGSIRIALAAAGERGAAARLATRLEDDTAVVSVETSEAPAGRWVVAAGPDADRLALAVTRAIAAAGVDVDLVESSRGPS
jgi:ABC-type multidrug transport system ATPase subunit